MRDSLQCLKEFMLDEDGAVMVEYGLLATLIALAAASGAGLLGDGLRIVFTNIASCFSNGAGGVCPVP